MICPNCGTQNADNSKFCIRCGTNISADVTIDNSQPNMNSQVSYNSNLNSAQVQNANYQQATSVSNTNMSIKSCFSSILAVILKPFTAFKDELQKFDNFKNSAIISLIVSIFATIVSLVKTMLSTITVKSLDWTSGKYVTTWEWGNLKEINYIQVIGRSFLIYIGIILAIAVVYYIAGLIAKKQTSFSRLLGISAISVVPMFVCSLILSPLLAMIYRPLGIIITIAGGVYATLLVYEEINKELALEGNDKYYLNLVCLSILFIAAYYLYMNVLIGSVSNSINDILNMFN